MHLPNSLLAFIPGPKADGAVGRALGVRPASHQKPLQSLAAATVAASAEGVSLRPPTAPACGWGNPPPESVPSLQRPSFPSTWFGRGWKAEDYRHAVQPHKPAWNPMVVFFHPLPLLSFSFLWGTGFPTSPPAPGSISWQGVVGNKFTFNHAHGNHYEQGQCSCPGAQTPFCLKGLGFTKLSGLEHNF